VTADPEAASRQWTEHVVRQRAAQHAWHAYNDMERAIGAVRAAMDDAGTPAEWQDQLRAVCLRAGALAIGQEG